MLKYGAALLAAALVAGCATTPTKSKDEQYLDALVGQQVVSRQAAKVYRHDLIAQAKSWCAALRDPSATPEHATKVLREHADIANMLRLSARYYCPAAGHRLLGQ